MTDDNELISISAAPRKKIPVDLVGVRYQVFPPKGALALELGIQTKKAGDDPSAAWDMVEKWVDRAFGKVDARKIKARLSDDNDDLDIAHLMQLMTVLMERMSGNPTSSSDEKPSSS